MSREQVLDLKGVVCPYTQLNVIKALQKIPPSAFLKIIVDNPTSLEGVVVTVKNAGHKVAQVTQKGPVFTITIKKKGDV